MSTIDDLLAQSLLLHQPHVPCDVVPYDDLAHDDPTAGHLLRDAGPQTADDSAAQHLTALCEAVVTHCTIEQLADFLTEHVPQPRTARILGCALQLAGADDGARFWWQFAAGADDVPASYCLYLQHLTQGDPHAAALWQTWPDTPELLDDGPDAAGPVEDAPAYRMMTADTSLTTVLRVLSRLTRANPRRHTPMAQAVIEFVSAEVAVAAHRHPDLELPLPGDDFAELLEILAIAASDTGRHTTATDTVTATPRNLPNRPRDTDSDSECAPARMPDPEKVLMNVTADGHDEPAITDRFFKEASAACDWEAVTTDSTETRGTRTSYYLSRLRIRAARTFSPAPSGFGTWAPSGFGSPSFRGI